MDNAATLSPIASRAARPLRVGNVEVPTRFSLAPLAGYTTLAFRLAVREIGGLGLATTDLVSARAMVRHFNRKTLELIQSCPEDRPLAVQIYGNDGPEMADAARFLQERGIPVVDINMGCPVRKVCQNGGGSAMMCDPAATIKLVRTVVEAVRIPITVKMRLGWDDSDWTAPFFAREFEQAGVAAVTIHGRTREQGFGGKVKLDGIRAVVEAVERIPVIGNGDVRSRADALHMMEYTGCQAVAIGRGALLNPWIFSQLQQFLASGETPRPATYEQRLGFMDRHLHGLVQFRGERFGCLSFRKVANWYCKTIRPGHEYQQRLVRLESTAELEEIVERLRDRGPPPDFGRFEEMGAAIATPAGPNAHW
ncbi:MAG: tRNA dihydrouridine synthase DusB [Planctomycetia bacterium]|nr:tRNA dihydrouridine synthase DusB [Planctomycetia bacterium]